MSRASPFAGGPRHLLFPPCGFGGADRPGGLSRMAERHLWSHLSTPTDLPVIERDEDWSIRANSGYRLLDVLAGLFAPSLGCGRVELAEATRDQMKCLAYFRQWGYGHPCGVELAARLAVSAPGDLRLMVHTNPRRRPFRCRRRSTKTPGGRL